MSYLLTRKAVKNINLRIHGDGTVVVSVPCGLPKEEVDRFVAGRWAWISTHLARLADTDPCPPLPVLGPEETLARLTEALKRMLRLTVPLGVAQPELRVRQMRSRWGSCHYTKGVIVLNAFLASVPEPLRDYVALHELVHFLHPNHGSGFHAVLTALMPDWKQRRGALRPYEHLLR